MPEEKDPRFPDIDKLPLLGWKPGDDEPLQKLPEGALPVRLLPGQRVSPPAILWGDRFEEGHKDCMPLQWQIDRMKKVASAMNHAAWHAQELLKQNIAIAEHQEEQLHKHVAHNISVDEMLQQMTESVNAEANARTHEILELRKMLRATRKEAVKYALMAADVFVDAATTMSWGGKTLGERLAEQDEQQKLEEEGHAVH